MLNYLDRFIKKILNKQKDLIIGKTSIGLVTIKKEVIHSLINFVLKEYDLFIDAEIEITDFNNNQLKLFIITDKSFSSTSNNKINIIKSKLRSSLKSNGFQITRLLISSKEILKEG